MLTALDIREHTIRGCEVRDPDGDLVGVVDDVLFDELSQEPMLLVVHPTGWIHRLLHDDHYLPATHGHFEGDTVVADFPKDEILRAPLAPYHHHVVDDRIERQIAEHYHLAN